MKLPTVSIIIPTYNSARTLPECLDSIQSQDYPRELLEIIIADAGSTDRTVEIARQSPLPLRLVPNLLRTGEAGKAAGLKESRHEIAAFVDSDNVLESRDWLRRMTAPFADASIAGTEPLYYTRRREDGYLTRYFALIGMNDPFCLFMGNYDRYSHITGRWTEAPIIEEDNADYIRVTLRPDRLPTIGANGFLVRRRLLEAARGGGEGQAGPPDLSEYIFDIDLVYDLVRQGHDRFAKVKVGIVHLFSNSAATFARKQRRRIRDHAYYQKLGLRRYPWSACSKSSIIRFILTTVTVVPLLVQMGQGYRRQKDSAWWFHVPACWITLAVYSWGTLGNLLGARPEDRNQWKGQG